MRILITGAGGRLGSELARALTSQQHAVTGVDMDTVDITDREGVGAAFAAASPELVVHCAALTAVDFCADHPDEALRVNGYGTQIIAQACLRHGAALAYLSTNEVFDGQECRPRLEYDPPRPANPYGYSKWVGEQAVRDLVSRHFIIRTSWLFAHGGRNFIHTVLQRAREGQPLRVVVNEVSSPTYANDLAAAIARLVVTGSYGIYHLANEGYASRWQFAREALDQAGFGAVPIEPIALAEFARASRPPQYALLRNTAAARLGITLRPWQAALSAFLEAEGLRAR
ncbi:MAG: dTDP-4-dehydrorhamnose reductase [Anaerolineae bacterium]|nr:dTDP-4-dehydrorhamnose reductase [Anaerolineae bacterium]